MDLKTRVKNMLTAPEAEWPVIAAEPTDVGQLYRGYIMPLAAIPAICGFIGVDLLFRQYHLGVGIGLADALVRYVMTLVGVSAMGLVIGKLAPRFGAPEAPVQGLKLVAYSATPAWIGGVCLLIPVLGVVTALLSLYGLYLLYQGLPIVMGTPQANTTPYFVTSIGAALLVLIVLGILRSVLLY